MNDNDTLEHAEDTMPVTDTDVEIEFGTADDESESPVTETAAEETPTEGKKRGPKGIFERDGAVEAALLAIHAGAGADGEKMPSRFIEKQLAEAGMVHFQSVKTPGAVGRPRHVAMLTAAGLVRIGFTE